MSYGALVVASCPPPVAGQSVATVMLLRALAARGTPVQVVDLAEAFTTQASLWTRGRRAARVARLPVEVGLAARRLRPSRVLFYLQLGHGRAAMLRDLPLLLLARARRWPAVLHIHGGGYRSAFEALPTPLRLAVGAALQGATCIIVLSESLQAQVEGLVAPDRIAVLANGVDQGLADAAAACGRDEPAAPALEVLFLSNLIAAKGYLDVLEAARLAQERGLPHRFALGGAVTESTHLHPNDAIRRYGLRNTTYLGEVGGAAKADVLCRAGAFVLAPTAAEGQPIALLEAMHFGLPIITTRMGGIPDIVAEGEHGLFVPPNRPAAILDAVERLAADPALRARMGARSRADARARHTEAAHTAGLLALLDAAAHGAGGPRAAG